MVFLYRLYQILIFFPIFFVTSVLTSLSTVVGCMIGNGHFWGYYPGKYWSRLTIYLLLLPIKVNGREHLKDGQSYIFVANHQGAFDIFIIYGFLNRNFKWMMKKGLKKVPFVGIACEYAHHIFVDKSGPSKIRKTYETARNILKEGMSMVVFPEGARTFTGHMGVFRRGAFMLADDLQLPVCPLTINGSFDVKSRTHDFYWIFYHPLSLTIHEPIYPIGHGPENIKNQMTKSYEAVMSGLTPEYQGFIENPDQ
nr:1-acyl-sn-glycerol-3-phosphate acyltransferase [Prevotella sp.]